MKRAPRLDELAERSEHLDKAIGERMSGFVKVAAATARLGLLTVLTFLLRWPAWQITSLYTRGFSVAGFVEPSNIYPDARPNGPCTLHDLLDETDADTSNCRLDADIKPFDHDQDVWDTARDQSDRHLLSEVLTKQDVDSIFGEGKRRCIRRRGIW